MGFRSEVSRSVKWRERRRGVRMNSRIRLVLEWTGADGKQHRFEAQTRVVSPYGCLVVLPYDLPLDHSMRVTNLANSQSAAAAIVWKGKQRVEGWELGIELTDPDMDFWNLQL